MALLENWRAWPGARLLVWTLELREAFGWQLLLCLLIIQGVLKGMVGGGGNSGLAGIPIEFLLREYGVKAASMQVYKAAVLIPWSVKPLFGLLSDAVPICGYHRRSYLAILGIAGCAAHFFVATASSHLVILLILLFVVIFQIAMSDLLSEAIYSIHLRGSSGHGPDLISFVWGTIAVGKLVGVAMVGSLITNLGPRGPYGVCVVIVASTLLVPLLNLSGEQRGFERCCGTATRTEPLLAFQACLTGVGSLALAALSVLSANLAVKVFAAFLLAVIVLGSAVLVLTPVIAKVAAFFFIQHLCTWSVDGAAYYFFTDGEKQYPEGPHFSTVFYTSVLGLVSTAFSLTGMYAYTRWMKTWRYPRVLVVGNVLYSAVGLVSCMVFLRLNVRLGIDDHFFVLASSAVQTVVFEMAWLPGMLILSQLCPEGREATVFALLAGMGNLGMILGGYFGAYLLHVLGVEPKGVDGESAQFSRLWLAALLTSLGPCVPLFLAKRLIPDVSQQDRVEGVESATGDSLLAKMMGWHRVPSGPRTVELHSMVGRTCADGLDIVEIDAEAFGRIPVTQVPSGGQDD